MANVFAVWKRLISVKIRFDEITFSRFIRLARVLLFVFRFDKAADGRLAREFLFSLGLSFLDVSRLFNRRGHHNFYSQ